MNRNSKPQQQPLQRINIDAENQGKKALSANAYAENFKNRNALEAKLQNTSGSSNENVNVRLGSVPEPKKLSTQTGGLYSNYFDNIASQINPQRAPMTVEEMLKMKKE